MLFFPVFFALIGGLLLQLILGYNFSVAVAVGYIDLFGIAVETAVVMIVYLHEALDAHLALGIPLKHEDIEAATIAIAVMILVPILFANKALRPSALAAIGKSILARIR